MTDARTRPDEYDFDNTDPTLFPHLFETLNEMRETCPVAWSPHFGGFWALSRYDDVTAAANDFRQFTSAQGIMMPPTGASMKVIPAEVDPPRHTKLRKVEAPYFSGPALEQWVPGIRQLFADAFAPVLAVGRADLVKDVARPVPVLAISLILGMLGEDWRQIRDLAEQFLAATGQPDVARARAKELESYLEEQIEQRRDREPEDILGHLVHSKIDGEPLTPAEVLGLVQLTVVAGHETTVNGIATLVYRVIVEPGLKDRLIADRSLIPATIDESLRLHPPVWNMARTVAEDTEVRGTSMCAGERVMLMYGAANRDPEKFEDPESFIVPREANRHLTFGSGRHRCLGEPLAKIELTAALDFILDTIPDIELDGEPEWGGGTNQHGMRSLPIRFTPPAS